MSCQAQTKKGTQCKNKKSGTTDFCGRHKNHIPDDNEEKKLDY